MKLINNCHTDLIYSYGNEVALFAERLSLDPMELIRAANLDYPRPDLARPGFVGGGCLSKDPYILMASAETVGHEPWLVGHARRLNEHLPSTSPSASSSCWDRRGAGSTARASRSSASPTRAGRRPTTCAARRSSRCSSAFGPLR